MECSVNSLLGRGEYMCSCGKLHKPGLKEACIEKNAIDRLPDLIWKFGGTRVFLLADENTFECAGKKITEILVNNGLSFSKYIFRGTERIEPDEKHIGSVLLHFDKSCDLIIGVGSGVINDIGKILAGATKLPYFIVATAPSMDGFASSTSSVIRDSLKVSVDSTCPDVVIGDTEILRNAPFEMLQAGLGDMIAKYVSVCEWKIGHEVIGEYYCEDVAQIIRLALKKCVDGATGLINRDEESVRSVMEGLVISGIAADYAGVSRPVSGVEHYFSHIWDMRALEFGTPWALHGIQCGIGTLYALKYYEALPDEAPDTRKALAFVENHDDCAWFEKIREYIGSAGAVMIENALDDDRYDRVKHSERLENIVEKWDDIKRIVLTELPTYDSMKSLMADLQFPLYSKDIGLDEKDIPVTLRMTRDIRDKYILSSLMWDMGAF